MDFSTHSQHIFCRSGLKKILLCLLISAVFFVVSCGGSKKNWDQPEQTGDSHNITDDNDIFSDYDDAATDDDTAAETEITADEDLSDNENITTDEDIEDEDTPAESDQATDDDTVTDEDISADADETIDEDIETDDNATDDDNINDSDKITDNDDPGCDLEHGVTFIKKPDKMNIAPNGRSVSLVCEAETQGCGITYQWYESHSNSTNSGVALSDATNPTFETPAFTQRGIHYYYCAATASTPSGENKTFLSNVASVAYTALPTLYVNTPDGIEITSKEDWIKNAHISIVGADNESWNFENIETSIKGRGNTTWERPKKPYALKLKQAREIMGMPAHKRWVLLANYWDGSFMRNELAFYFSRLFELGWTVHGQFVDLVLNGRYNGLYWLGEAIKVDKNRVDINDGNTDMTDGEDKDYLIEMDNSFDENIKFKSEIRNFPYMIQNDDYMVDENDEITTGGTARLERLQARINDLERLLYPDFTAVLDTNDCSAPDESYSEIIDIDSWVKFWFVNEIMDNRDSGLPKSDFFTFDSTDNIFKAGPVWDFDLAATHRPTSCQLNKKIYYNALFKSPKFIARTKELWNEYSGRIDIYPQIENIQNRIVVAAEYDAMLWTGHHDYINLLQSNNTVKFFEEYVEFLEGSIRQKISVMNSFIEDLSVPETNP